ncbi:hypothetical protein NU219Hw_g5252t1 [Hortaea werneckii]
MVGGDTCVKPAAAPVRLTKLLTDRERKSAEIVGRAPSRIHASNVNGHRGGVSYIGSGWYRSVPASEHGKIAPGPKAPATRKDFYQAVEAYRQKHPDVIAKHFPTPPEDGQKEHARKRRPQERSPETALTSGQGMTSPRNRVATRSSTRITAARRRLGRTRETTTEQVHVTRLKDYPGAEFTAVGDGWYVQDSSRTGAWVVVPVDPRSPAS